MVYRGRHRLDRGPLTAVTPGIPVHRVQSRYRLERKPKARMCCRFPVRTALSLRAINDSGLPLVVQSGSRERRHLEPPRYRNHARATFWDQPEGLKEKWRKREG